MKKQKGFTIIELLVVVAIIAVLTGIVLVNVTSYINKGKDAAVQGNLSSVLTDMAVYYDTNGNYTAACADASVAAALAAADRAFDGNAVANEVTDCNGAVAAWAACGQLKVTDSYFCVDSTGTKKSNATRTTCTSLWAATVCP
ncbi:prepilin-type N-terminal cleavage/methylation domain-containing protein [Candidatus Parcubacteria bacterium]|nr:prepilin-type N-terminal cleavage/methylation domain-containing protein [Candidatus Parcubacteria bacterium]